MNVVSEIFLSHRKYRNVGQGADVSELLQLVLNQARIDTAPEDHLEKVETF